VNRICKMNGAPGTRTAGTPFAIANKRFPVWFYPFREKPELIRSAIIAVMVHVSGTIKEYGERGQKSTGQVSGEMERQ
jgi:hypothetical protein